MIERPTDAESIRNAERRIKELIGRHGEWLCVQGARTASLGQGEFDLRVSNGRLIFSYCGERGATYWRITGWEWTGGKLLLEASRRMGAERARLELIPRASARATAAMLGAARKERSRRLAELARARMHGGRIERAGLSPGASAGQPGRYARIVLSDGRVRVAVTGAVTNLERQDVDPFLSSSLLWFMRARDHVRRPHVRKLWLIVNGDCAGELSERLALLRADLLRSIELFRIDDEWQGLTPAEVPGLDKLLSSGGARFRSPAEAAAASEGARRIIALAPEAVDVVRSRQGETLRYNGLAFARVRRVMGKESIWFGVEGARRRLLDEDTLCEWTKLLEDLEERRRAEVKDHHHALYRAAPEAWLESILRRDITRLDPGLRLAPLYAQFRPAHAAAGSRPIDLLALRRDGRLVVIELKVSEDREHVLQGADYCRRVETQRRAGHVSRSRIFGDAEIADEPPLVYLVAPTLRFHRAFDTLARAVNPAIELYRFDINEDWRAGVRVVRRCDLT